MGAPYFTAVLKSFEAKYGIPVESLDLRASELSERIRTEQAAGRYLGDAEMVTTTMIEEQLKNGDFMQKLPPIPNAANLRPPFKANEYSVPAFVQPMGILINTRLVKEQDIPTSWNDLNDPEMEGQDPLGRHAAARQRQYHVRHPGKDHGRRLQREAGRAKARVQPRHAQRRAPRRSRRVRRSISRRSLPSRPDLKGLPVKVVIPKEGAPYAEMDLAVLKNAPHPNAARLFIDHFLSVESQLLYANAWMLPVNAAAAERANPDAQPFVNAKIIGPAKLAERSSMMASRQEALPLREPMTRFSRRASEQPRRERVRPA